MQSKKIISFLIITFFSVVFFQITTSHADSNAPSNEQIENIKTNCSSIKHSLKQVQNSDRNTRVAIGYSYQTILADFMTPLNVRLIKNNLIRPELSEIQNRFTNLREEFNHKYIEYSQELESLINIDCISEPESFYHRLESTRNKRSEVLNLAEQIDSTIANHKSVIENLKNSLGSNQNEI